MILRGHLGTTPDSRCDENGGHFTRFRMAVPKNRRKDDGQWEQLDSVWYTVKSWGKLAQHTALSLKKGDAVIVVGRPAAQAWEKDGELHSEVAVHASSVGHDLVFGITTLNKLVSAQKSDAGQEDGAEVSPVADPVVVAAAGADLPEEPPF